MAEPGAAQITEFPSTGRVHKTARRMRLADVDPTGRCRLDSLARHLQDIARDDSAASGLGDAMNWVVRRTMIEVRTAPRFQEWVELSTWCSGHGGRWAERRTSLVGDLGASVEAVTVWIFVDAQTGAPRKLNPDFFEIYGSVAGARKISARLTLDSTPPDGAESTDWPVRFADLDILDHVNNAAQWVAVEEAMDRVGLARQPICAELEHGLGVERDGSVTLRWMPADGGFDSWLMTEAGAGSVARVRPL